MDESLFCEEILLRSIVMQWILKKFQNFYFLHFVLFLIEFLPILFFSPSLNFDCSFFFHHIIITVHLFALFNSTTENFSTWVNRYRLRTTRPDQTVCLS